MHNIVRLREMIRYLSPSKLTLFKEIPFLIHVNTPDFPGYVKTAGNIFGIWNFENSGFAKDIAAKYPAARNLLLEECHDPAVQAIYHIGSLGTFTQSVKSDFDFWVIIDKSEFDDERINALHEKLSLITTYSRKSFSQEVTFFVHYANNLRENIFDNPDDEDTVTVPELLLKEEFYRTFIMVAGKVPLWAIQPLDLNIDQIDTWKKQALEYGGFIDLGTIDSIPDEEIQRGLLWQICKAPYDPVKSVIKASITASYNVKDAKKKPTLLCDKVKQRFGDSIIDDYAADPYIIAFEQIIEFYRVLDDPRALSQIKAAIFFRLCSFPLVSLPAKESPKRKILDRYVKKWQLSSTRLKKLLEYQKWPESEKSLFDKTMIDRLYWLYKRSLKQKDITNKSDNAKTVKKQATEHLFSSAINKKEADLNILKNKVNKITVKKKGALPTCSTYLRLKPHSKIILIGQKKEDVSKKDTSWEWLLFSQIQSGQQEKKYDRIYTNSYFFNSIGWSMYNHIYIRGTTQLDIRSPFRLYTSTDKKVDCDDIYLALQPWMPLSDEAFAMPPFWEKIVVVLFTDDSDKTSNNADNDINIADVANIPRQAEFLVRNSWGEIFFEVLHFEQIDDLEKRCYHTAMRILRYHEENSNYAIFQMASRPVSQLIQKIKTIVEDTKFLKKQSDTTSIQRRPYLDTI